MDTLGHWSVISGHVSASSVRAPSIQTVIVHTATGWYAHTRGHTQRSRPALRREHVQHPSRVPARLLRNVAYHVEAEMT